MGHSIQYFEQIKPEKHQLESLYLAFWSEKIEKTSNRATLFDFLGRKPQRNPE